MAIKIQITIHDSDIEHLFNGKAPWYGKFFSIIGAVDKDEEVAKAITRQIDQKLSSNGIRAIVNYRTT